MRCKLTSSRGFEVAASRCFPAERNGETTQKSLWDVYIKGEVRLSARIIQITGLVGGFEDDRPAGDSCKSRQQPQFLCVSGLCKRQGRLGALSSFFHVFAAFSMARSCPIHQACAAKPSRCPAINEFCVLREKPSSLSPSPIASLALPVLRTHSPCPGESRPADGSKGQRLAAASRQNRKQPERKNKPSTEPGHVQGCLLTIELQPCETWSFETFSGR